MTNLGRRPRKLFELMSWVELVDAAHYLSSLLGEPIAAPELLLLGLEGHLTLSVRFLGGVPVQPGVTKAIEEVEVVRIPCLEGDGFFAHIDGTVLPSRDRVIVYEDGIDTISDVWDLPMIGGERLSVENLYEMYRAREAPDLINLDGTFVTDSRGRYCKLMERFEKPRDPEKPYYDPENFYPAATLPEDSVIVLRTEVLRDFAARLSDPDPEPAPRPLETRERSTLLVIIGALARLARIDVSKPSAAAAAIESETARMGARIAARTIENHLKRIAEAADNRAA